MLDTRLASVRGLPEHTTALHVGEASTSPLPVTVNAFPENEYDKGITLALAIPSRMVPVPARAQCVGSVTVPRFVEHVTLDVIVAARRGVPSNAKNTGTSGRCLTIDSFPPSDRTQSTSQGITGITRSRRVVSFARKHP
jgi:hypothetical protein